MTKHQPPRANDQTTHFFEGGRGDKGVHSLSHLTSYLTRRCTGVSVLTLSSIARWRGLEVFQVQSNLSVPLRRTVMRLWQPYRTETLSHFCAKVT